MAVAEVDQRVDRQAQTDAQQMMGELQAETARQKQELQFYRGLVVRQYGSGTLRVQELRVRAGRGGTPLPRADHAGAGGDPRYRGERHGDLLRSRAGRARKPRRCRCAEIEIDKRKQFPFSLRFFQQIEVPIELPLDFEPERLHVEYQLGRNPRAVEADVRLARGRRGRRAGALTRRGPDLQFDRRTRRRHWKQS